MNNYTYTYACSNIFNTIKMSGHSSLEKYTSHFIERIVCERLVGDWTELQHIAPPTLLAITTFLSRSPGCSIGGLGAQPLLGHGSHSSIFSLQLIWTSCRRGYIIIWHPPTSCERHICTQFNPSTVKVIPWSPDIFDRMHLLFTQVHFSSDSPAGSEVKMLQILNLRERH